MNSSSLDLMSYCLLAKKNLMYREALGTPFFVLTLYYRECFAPLEMLLWNYRVSYKIVEILKKINQNVGILYTIAFLPLP